MPPGSSWSAPWTSAIGSWDPTTPPPHTASTTWVLCSGLRANWIPPGALFERALDIRERILGPDHPDTAISLNDLGLLHWAQGELDAAKPLFERTLTIRERGLGPDHRLTAAILDDLALLLRAQGEPADARPLFERALHIREQVLGPDHPDTATTRRNLGNLTR